MVSALSDARIVNIEEHINALFTLVVAVMGMMNLMIGFVLTGKGGELRMILKIEKPESCMDCVFGEERGFCCSLLDGEQCYELHSEYDRPAWCPFDNGGKTITADGVSVVQEGVNCEQKRRDH